MQKAQNKSNSKPLKMYVGLHATVYNDILIIYNIYISVACGQACKSCFA